MESPLRTCLFCLIAEFRADSGASISHAYPSVPSIDDRCVHPDSALAELMLPDRMHSYSEDWTLLLTRPERVNQLGGARVHPFVASGGASTSPLCILSLSRTVPDSSARGATIVAMAIGTMFPHVSVFKVRAS